LLGLDERATSTEEIPQSLLTVRGWLLLSLFCYDRFDCVDHPTSVASVVVVILLFHQFIMSSYDYRDRDSHRDSHRDSYSSSSRRYDDRDRGSSDRYYDDRSSRGGYGYGGYPAPPPMGPRPSGRGRLYVANIGRARVEDLERLFAKYGRILDIAIKTGFAFVEYEDERDAADAVRYRDGYEWDGGRLRVEFSRPKMPMGGGGGGPMGGPPPMMGGPPMAGPRMGFGGAYPPKCFNCGEIGHKAFLCQAGDWSNRCYVCKQEGHRSNACPQRNGAAPPPVPSSSSKSAADASGSSSAAAAAAGGDDRRRSRSRSRSRSPRRDRSPSRSRSRSRSRGGRSRSRSPADRHPRSRSRSRERTEETNDAPNDRD